MKNLPLGIFEAKLSSSYSRYCQNQPGLWLGNAKALQKKGHYSDRYPVWWKGSRQGIVQNSLLRKNGYPSWWKGEKNIIIIQRSSQYREPYGFRPGTRETSFLDLFRDSDEFDYYNPDNYVNATSFEYDTEVESEVNRRIRQEYGRGPRASELLRGYLIKCGVQDPIQGGSNNQAHHIVEAGDRHAVFARQALRSMGIYINSAVNGVLLPMYTSDNHDITMHLGSHKREYANVINEAITVRFNGDIDANGYITLDEDTGRPFLIDLLNEIRVLLLTNPIKINSRVDDNWMINTDDEPIRTVFEGHGLLS